MPGMSAPDPPPPQPGSEPGWVDAGPLDAIERGGALQIAVGELRVAVFRGSDDGVYALADRCPHAGAPLSAGALRDGVIVCTWHGWRFEPGSGRCANVSWADPVPTHAARVVNGRVEVAVERRPPAG
jgi:nitrite reductase/ring-hydroxylating ferredoxin subunit